MSSEVHGASLAVTLGVLMVVAIVYVRGWYRLRRVYPELLNVRRLAAFLVGLFFLWAAIGSPLAGLDHQWLTAHMAQHLLVMTVAAPLILWGAPVITLLHGLPRRSAGIVMDLLARDPIARQLSRIMTYPWFCWLVVKEENPQALLDALDVIAQSKINHAKRALATGAAGLLVSVANANKKELSTDDYRKFSEPFDRRIFEATSGAKLNILHLHVEPEYLDFFRDFKAPVINYSQQVSGIPVAEVRKRFSWVIAGGIDEVNYRKLSKEELRAQWQAASKAAGAKFILTPGCSVPNDSQPEELAQLPHLLKA